MVNNQSEMPEFSSNIDNGVEREEMTQVEMQEKFEGIMNRVEGLADKHPGLAEDPLVGRLYEELNMMLDTVNVLSPDVLKRIELSYGSLKEYIEGTDDQLLEAADNHGEEVERNKYLDSQKNYPKKYAEMVTADWDMIKDYGFVFDESKSLKVNVKNLQRELRRVGVKEENLATGKNLTGIDGYYGPKTRAALIIVSGEGKKADTITENERENWKIEFDELAKDYAFSDLHELEEESNSPTLTSKRANELIGVLKNGITEKVITTAKGWFEKWETSDDIADLTKAVESEPKNDEYQSALGDAYYDLDNYADAVKAYKIAVDNKPKNADYQNDLGMAYFMAKDYTKATESYEKAVEIEPDSADF